MYICDMNKEELKKRSIKELEWMRYYGLREDRNNLDLNSNVEIYDQIRSIGYAKVNTDLDIRCNGYLSIKFESGKSIEELEVFNERRNINDNKFSPLEIFNKLYPNEIDICNELIKINR